MRVGHMNPATDINSEAQWARHSKTRIFFAVIQFQFNETCQHSVKSTVAAGRGLSPTGLLS